MAILGNMISALAGRTLAQTLGGAAAGPAGAALGIALPFVARRLGPLGMIGVAIGAWAVSRLLKQQEGRVVAPEHRAPIVTPPPIPMVLGD